MLLPRRQRLHPIKRAVAFSLALVVISAGCGSRTPTSAVGPPTDVIAVAGSGLAELSWMPPSGASPAYYGVYAFPQTPTGVIVTGATPSTVVTGLLNGVDYTFTVIAFDGGWGAWSAYSPYVRIGSVAAPQVHAQSDGSWQLTLAAPAWTLGGTIGHPLAGITSRTGVDQVGTFHETDLAYQDLPRSAAIRTYDGQGLVLFSSTFMGASANGEAFPAISLYPKLPHTQSYQGCFASSQFNSLNGAGDGPWFEFDTQGEGFILSPASHFLIANTSLAGGVISSGIISSISTLPAGFTQSTLLAYGAGPNQLYQSWGRALAALQGKALPANDAGPVLNQLGYWTDHGAVYYYSFVSSLGYGGTLDAAVKELANKHVPAGYVQLDSWWYPKGGGATWNGPGGIATYTAAPALFPNGLAAFQQSLGVPLAVHARWIDPTSPYHSQYTMSGDVITDPRYWASIAGYLHASGVSLYEQDWLCQNAQPVYNLTDPDLFMDGMAQATSDQGLAMQYCMPLPRDFLQSTRYSSLTNIRVSDDRFDSSKWTAFLYTSRLASALGDWPFSDVFMSGETMNLLLATLSAGPVGIGDGLGSVDEANLAQAVRPDGVIVKPDTAIVPTDQTYLMDAAGQPQAMVAFARSDHEIGSTLYFFAYSRQSGGTQSAALAPYSEGVSGPTYVYDYFGHIGHLLAPGATFNAVVSSGSYFVVAPVGASGMALLGDAGKFVMAGSKRISALNDDGSIHATLRFAPGEGPITLLGYSPSAPTVHALAGSVGMLSYDSTAHLFRFTVTPGPNATAQVTIALQPGKGPGAGGGLHLNYRPA